MSLTVKQFSNVDGFPKAAELIEITGAHALEASDRAIFNQLYQIAHESNRLVDPGCRLGNHIRFASARIVKTREQ